MDSTVQARATSPISPMVARTTGIPSLTLESAAENTSDTISTENGNQSRINHPHLRSRLTGAFLKLAYLKRCRTLKRPPATFRISASSLISSSTFMRTASKAESELLEDGIVSKQHEVHEIKRLIKDSDPTLLEPPRERVVDNLKEALDKKFTWLSKQCMLKWSDWPDKPPRHLNSSQRSAQSFSSPKRCKNATKRLQSAAK